MPIQNSIDVIDQIVQSGGPEVAEYKALLNASNVIHSYLYSEKNGLAFKSKDDTRFENFIKENWRVFCSTQTIQGFVRLKPHGYAGDFEVIEKTYSEAHSAKEEFSKWDRFFHASDGAIAVRNRASIFSECVANYNPKSILSVGCGPALDIRDSLVQSSVTSVTLVDNDKKALERAKVNLTAICTIINDIRPISIDYVQKNALRYRPEIQYDLIWSSGLFDYLNDKTAV